MTPASSSSAAPDAFSSGHDLKWSAAENISGPKTEDELTTTTDGLHQITRRIRSCPVPGIACVHGYAIGGAEIALSADLIVAAAILM
jgi:enoyl-CoA hydratase/carnithine racemase